MYHRNLIFSIKPQIFELKCVFSYFRLKTHITLLLPVYVHSWEQRKLGEVAKYRNGKAHENCIDESGKYIVVNSKFVSTNGTVIKHSNMQNEPLAQNEIAFVLSDVPNGRAIARTFLVEENDKYTLNQRIAGITSSENTYPYFLHILMNRHPYFLAFDDGVKQTNLSVSDVLNFETYYPEYEEQKQIGEYFRNLDRLITLHQRKCQIDGCRFQSPLAITWEQRKLGELALFNPKDELPQIFEYVDLESVVGTEMLSHRTETKSSAPSRAQRLARTGDLFYQTVRPYQKNNYLFEKPDNNYVFSTGYAQMRPCVDGYFLLSIVQSERFVKVVLDNCTGTSYPAINANDLAEIEVAAPSDECEADKIGSLFRNLDRLITLHQCE